MKIKQYLKYLLRFLFLQSLLSYLTIYYFNNFLIPKVDLYPDLVGYTFKDQIISNLNEDATRLFPNIDERLIRLDFFILLFIFVFLLYLYTTKFYTYVNELSFSLDRNYLGEYFNIYLVWTSSLLIFITLFRFGNLISRAYLIVFTFIVPLILVLFRNTEFLSSILGRSVTSENYITFNLEDDSIFRKLRILTFRKEVNNFQISDINDAKNIIDKIDKQNKEKNVNLIVINFGKSKQIDEELENYLIDLNKKVLIMSKENIVFNNLFISRSEKISNYFLTYFNNDVQYGAKYILKRIIDVFISTACILIFLPLFIVISLYIYFIDGGPTIIKQYRVGLHGKQFRMYKFRTMKNNSHKMRNELEDLNKNDEIIFKIENDPRLLKGASILRNYSLDEIPQFINVLKGEMSMVGPRPLFDEDTKLFDEKYMRRLNVLPGITGLLQINDRNTSEFSTWYKYDIEYIDNWSIFLDLRIIFKTPFSLFKRSVKGM
jgi:lipopolysaccharide/colanic/teichoic acid biosynthesis glycosyltransferase